MSGGHFDYKQYELGYIADSIENEIYKNGRKLTDEEREDHFSDVEYFYEYPEEVIDKFKLAVKYIRVAEIYANRIDWLLSGDDGEESFLRRLNNELDELITCIEKDLIGNDHKELKFIDDGIKMYAEAYFKKYIRNKLYEYELYVGDYTSKEKIDAEIDMFIKLNGLLPNY